IMNHYGPTETTIGSVARFIDFGTIEEYKAAPTIGRPIYNTRVYILDKYSRLVPVGIPGELCIGGSGVARGYLDRPELTNERFCDAPETGDTRDTTADRRQKIYRTGDLASWQPDGNIRFLGRIDHQVKIRGFRVELGEIENRLLSHEEVKEAVVIAYEDRKGKGGKYLCAYVVPESAEPADMSRLRTFLAKELPNYMIPSYIMPLEKLPLTPNGKLDRKALPTPGIVIAADTYSPPGNPVEHRLVDIWAEELKLEKDSISIDADFFQMGGHSLLAIKLIAKIHKYFDIKLTLGKIFLAPTVRELAHRIGETGKKNYRAILLVEKKTYYRLSSAQKRLYVLQQMELESTAYNMPTVFPRKGEIDRIKFENTFKQLIRRHESLRTSFNMIEDEPVQIIHDRVEFKVEYDELSGRESGAPGTTEETETTGMPEKEPFEGKIENFIRPFGLSCAPLFRVKLLKITEGSHLVMVDMHHSISDGISGQILVKEFRQLEAGEQLPPLKLQYKDFANWQNRQEKTQEYQKQETFWLKRFKDRVPQLDLPVDYPRSDTPGHAGRHHFNMAKNAADNIRKLLSETGCTMYIFLSATFSILLSKYSNRQDILVGSPIAGRTHGDLSGIIGMFVNMVVMRNVPALNKTFNRYLDEVRTDTIQALENQDYQFEELVNKLELPRRANRNPLTDIVFAMDSIKMARSEEKSESDPGMVDNGNEKQPATPFQTTGIAKFDITFNALDTGDEIAFHFEYRKNLFKESTIERMGKHLLKVMDIVTAEPGIRISDIYLLDKKEKEELKKIVTHKKDKGKPPKPAAAGKIKMEADFDF
ncbi:MAG: AMP-binding protein, partial [bacterium]|nr:AMP-binding protein [bacterium]